MPLTLSHLGRPWRDCKRMRGEEMMTWLAYLGNKSRWTKKKFDPTVCCEANTSNFVESFNSTLGVDRCRLVLTLLEGETDNIGSFIFFLLTLHGF